MYESLRTTVSAKNTVLKMFCIVLLKKKVIDILDALRVSKLTANVHFEVKYPFKVAFYFVQKKTFKFEVHYKYRLKTIQHGSFFTRADDDKSVVDLLCSV